MIARFKAVINKLTLVYFANKLSDSKIGGVQLVPESDLWLVPPTTPTPLLS